MEKTDRRILKILMKDDKIPFLKIAKELRVSPKTVKKSYEEMKEERFVLRDSILLDLSKLGYCGQIYLMITTVSNKEKITIMSSLKNIRNIFVVGEIAGDFDIIAIAVISDYKSIKTIVNEVRKIEGIEKIETTIVNNVKWPINPQFNRHMPKLLPRE
jgi:DNA-binding Lrp family transcriptional regulator